MAEGGSEAFDPIDFRLKRLEGDMAEVKIDLKAFRGEMRNEIGTLRTELRADTSSVRSDINSLREDISYIRGRLDTMPTTIQLVGFIVAIFVASGLTRYFGH
jgi:hypothetical protein